MYPEELVYINVIVANSASSFCQYDKPSDQEDENQFMPLELLRKVITFSSEHGLYLNVLCGNESLPTELIDKINKADHLKFIPLSNPDSAEECIVIVDEQDYNNISRLPDDTIETIILRIKKKNLPDLANLANQYSEKCRKLNIVLAGLEEFSPTDIYLYEEQISDLAGLVSDRLKRGNEIEINCLTDRIVLKEMNNCDAGIKHITFAPDGNFYLCPGFYYDNDFTDIGNINDGINIKNPDLLTLDKSPICRICDAYQCKRCIYLNKKMTAEINVPSYEQCVCSHIERNGTRSVIANLKYSNSRFHHIMDIGQLPYMDPYVKLKESMGKALKVKKASINDLPPLEPLIVPDSKEKDPVQARMGDSNKPDEKEILKNIHNTQVEILKMLKYLRGI